MIDSTEKNPSKSRKKIYDQFGEYDEAFFMYGAAMYCVQPLEDLLEQIIDGFIEIGVVEYVNKGWDWESIAETKQTLGKLTAVMNGYFAKHYPKEAKIFRKRFQKCVKERNWLAHDFFTENYHFLKTGLPKSVIDRLYSDIETFSQMAYFLTEILTIVKKTIENDSSVSDNSD